MPPEPSVEFLTEIIELVAHPIFVKDRQFRFVLLNRAFCEMAGFRPRRDARKTDYGLLPQRAERLLSLQRHRDVHHRSGGANRGGADHRLVRRGAHPRHHQVPLRDETGAVTHLVGIIKDITDLKNAQRDLREANELLERRVAERTAELAEAEHELLRKERLAVLGQLAGGLAHQLRNPLGAIQNAVALLRRENHVEGSMQALSIIDEEVHRADRTIRDLLDYAAIRPPHVQEVCCRSSSSRPSIWRIP